MNRSSNYPRFNDPLSPWTFTAAAGFAILLLSGCTYGLNGSNESHFRQYQTALPKGDTVTVCSGYGCKAQTTYPFSRADILHIAGIFQSVPRSRSAAEERRAIAYAVAWIEAKVGNDIGTANDRPSIDIAASGDPGQMDCVDEATNSTSYLLIMEKHGLLKFHTVSSPISKGNLIDGRWPHYGARIHETKTDIDWTVDSSMYANGERPIIMPSNDWYIPS